MARQKFDLFIFGSTSELIQAFMTDYKDWFQENVHQLYVIQRKESYPEVYQDFNPISIALEVADIKDFRKGLNELVEKYATTERKMHVFPTYGVFNWNYAPKNPVFSFQEDALQINLNARLQIIEAFRKYASNTKFHLFGSLFSAFPYTGDYALSMWYINQLPKNAEYKDLDMIIYNLGGMKTRFWKHAEGPKNNPFLHDKLPTDKIFETGFQNDGKGVHTFYPSLMARFATFLGRKGVRML
jgi:hypothetical protein